jgi:endonuclease YncB( thermonuclease family)
MKHLAGLLLGRAVDIKEFARDRYGRLLAVVFSHGSNVKLEMVKVGVASVY